MRMEGDGVVRQVPGARGCCRLMFGAIPDGALVLVIRCIFSSIKDDNKEAFFETVTDLQGLTRK